MKSVGLVEAKTRLSELCREVAESGQPILIQRRGTPIAELVPPRRPQTQPRVPGRLAGQFKVADDLLFAPLPETDFQLWEAGAAPPTAPAIPSS